MRKTPLFVVTAFLTALTLVPGPVFAADATWNGGSISSPNWGADGAYGNWSLAPAPGSTVGISADVANFSTVFNTWGGSAAEAILIDSATQHIGGMTFSGTANTCFIGTTGGNSLFLNNGGTIQITSLSGTGMTETIAAPLVIEGTSTTGYTFSNNSAANTAVLNIAGGITGAAGAGDIKILLNGTNTDNNVISGSISTGSADALGIQKYGTGTWVLEAANTYTGATTVVAGTLIITNNDALGSSGLHHGTQVMAGATLGLKEGLTVAENIMISGTGTNGLGALNSLTGNNILTGSIDITASATIGTALGSTLTLSGGSVGIVASTLTFASIGNTVVDDVIDGTTGGIVKTGVGTLTLNGANGYGGATNINGGIVKISSTNNLGDGSETNTIGINGGTLESTLSDIDLGVNRTITLGSSGATIQVDDHILTADGVVSGTGSLTKTGAGTLSLGGINTYTGATLVNAGLLQITSATGLGSIAAGTSVATGATLDLAGDFAVGAENLTLADGSTLSSSLGTNSLAGTVTITGTGIATMDVSGMSLGLSGAISGGGLTKTGNGDLILGGTNTYTGLTTINAGTLRITSATGLGASGTALNGTSVASGAILDLSGNFAVGTEQVTLATGAILSSSLGTNSLAGAVQMTGVDVIDVDGTSLTLSGIVSGTGAVLGKTGAGTLTLSGTNTYTGDTVIVEGVIKLGNARGLGTATAGVGTTVTGDGAALDLNGQTVVAEEIYLNGTGMAGGGALINSSTTAASLSGNIRLDSASSIGGAGSMTLSGVLSSSAAFDLTKVGAGTVTLSGNNSGYDDTIIINEGTIKVGHVNGLGSTSGSTVVSATGAALDLNGKVVGNEAVILNGTGVSDTGALVNSSAVAASLSGAITLASDSTIASNGTGGMTLTGGIDNGGFDVTFAGAHTTTVATSAITGNGGLVKNGTGTLNLNEANSYRGTTTINAGTVAVTVNNGLGTADGGTVVGTGAILDLQNIDYTTLEGLTLAGGAIGTSTGTSEFHSGITLTATGLVTVTGTQLTLSGMIDDGADTFGLTKSGSGILVLTRANTYAGTTNINGGTIQIDSADNLGDKTQATNTIGMDGGTLEVTASGINLGTNRGITLGAGGGTIQVDGTSASTLTASGTISGTGGLTKTGDGTLIVTGTNTYSGTTAVNTGALKITTAAGLGSTAAGTSVAGGATLDLAGTFAVGAENLSLADGSLLLSSSGTNSLAGTVDLGATTGATIDVTTALGLSGVVSGGAMTKIGSGMLTLGGANTYTGLTTISVGTLKVTSATGLGVSGTALDGTFVATGAILDLAGDFAMGAEQVTLDVGSTLSSSSGTNSLAGAVSMGAFGTIDVSGTSLTLSGIVSGGQLIKIGTGLLSLGGVNTYTGTTAVTQGTVRITGAAGLGDIAAGTSVATGAILDLAGTFAVGAEAITLADGATLSSSSGANTIAGTVALGSTGSTVSVTGTSLGLSGLVSGGALTKTGSGILTLGRENDYTGLTTVNAGTLAVTADDALGTIDAGTVVNAGTLDFQNVTYETEEALTLAGGAVGTSTGTSSFAGDITLTATGMVSVAGTQLTLSGIIDDGLGSFGLTKSGAGIVLLSGENTYDGITTISAGTVRVGHSSALGTAVAGVGTGVGTVVSGTGAALDLYGYDVVNEELTLNGAGVSGGGALLNSSATAASLSGTITLASASTITSTGTGGLTLTGGIINGGFALTFNGANATTVSGTGISGTGALVKSGAGTLNLNVASDYTGVTTISGGTVKLGDSAALGATGGGLATSGTTVASGAALDLNGQAVSNEAVTLNGTGVSGSGALVNTSSSAASLSGRVTLATASTITSTGTGGLTLTGGITSGALALTFDGVSNTTISSTGITGSGNLVKNGTGILDLNVANTTYTGAIIVNAGTLRVSNDAGLGTTANGVSVAAAGTLDIANNAHVGAEAVTLASGATLGSSSGDNSLSGTVSMTGTGNMAVDGTLTLSGIVSGTSGLTKTGTGTLVLSGANTYSGVTAINGGTVQISAANNLGNSATTNTISLDNGTLKTTATMSLGTNRSIVLANIGTIEVDASTVLTASSVISGAGQLKKTGDGQLTLGGTSANTYTGGTDVNAGTLLLNKTAGINAIAGDVTVSGGTLQWQANNQIVDTANIVLDSGIVSLNGKTETVATFTNNGGTFTTGAGHLLGTGNTITFAGGDTTINNGGLVEDAHVVISGGTVTVEGGSTGGVLQINAGGTGLEMSNGATLTLNSHTVTGGRLLLNSDLITSGDLAVTITSDTTYANRGTIDLGGTTRIIDVSEGLAANDLVLNAVITNGSLTKDALILGSGAGTLLLSMVNTYTGATTVNTGTLKLGVDNAINSASALAVGAAGTFDLNGKAETLASISGEGTITNTGTLKTFTVGNTTSTTFSGVMTGAINLTKVGTGTLTLGGANSYTGATAINAGTVVVTADGALGTTDGATTVASGAMLGISGGVAYNTAEAVTLNGTGISGAGALNNISGANAFAAEITLGSATTIGVTAGTLNLTGTVGGGYALTKVGAGTLMLSGSNTYTGTTIVSAGELDLNNLSGNAIAGDVTISGGTLLWLADNQIADTSNVTLTSGTLNLNGHTEVVNTFIFNGGTFTTGTGGVFLVRAGSSLTFTGTSVNTVAAYSTVESPDIVISGGTNTVLAGGTLKLASGGTNGLVMSNGSLLTLTSDAVTAGKLLLQGNVSTSGNSTVTIASSGSAAYEGTIDLDGGVRTFSVVNGTAADDLAISAVIINGGLTKTGTGTLLLSGNNTYTQGTTITAGTLKLGNDGVLADAGAVTIGVAGTLDLNGHTETIGALEASSATAVIKNGDAGSGTGVATLTAGGSSDSTFLGIIKNETGTGALSLVKAGTGTLVLGGTNTYNGTTTVSAGTLVVTANGALGTTTGGTTVSSGATLGISGGITYSTLEAVTLNGTGVSDVGALNNISGNNVFAGAITVGSGATIGAEAGTLNLTGKVSGTSGLTKVGAGTLMLSSQSNDYTGTTTVSAGTLKLGNNEVIVNTNAVSIGDSGTLDLNGYNETIGAFSGTGAITNTGTTATLTSGNSTSTEFSGVISGDLNLAKTGTGTLTLSGDNTYTGTTTISGGTLSIDSVGTGAAAQSLGTNTTSSAVTMSGGSTLQYTGAAGTLDKGIVLSGGADTIENAGTGALTLSGGIAINGVATSLTVTGAGDTEESGVISGTGRLIKTGSGTLTLSGSSANTYSGLTTVSEGTLELDKTAGVNAIGGNVLIAGGTLLWQTDNQVIDSATITMTSGVLNLNGHDETVASFVFNGGTFTTGGGSLSITSGALTWAGGTNTITADSRIEGASINITGGTNTVEGQGTGTTGGVLQLAGGILSMSGGSTLTLNSDAGTAGTLLLQGDVSTSGNATVTIASGGSAAHAGTIDLDGGSRTFSVGNGTAADDLSISAVIANGELIKTGAGTLLLSGANTYTGGTTVSAGTLKLGNDEVLADAGSVTVESAGTLDMNGNDETVASFSGAGSITNTGAGTSTLTAGSSSSTFSGAISGAIALVKTGSGTLTLSGNNTHTGGTTLGAGQLNLNSSRALGTGAFTILGGTIDNTSGSAVTLLHTNTQAWNGDFTFAGSNNLNLGTGAVTLGGDRTVTVSASTLTVGGVISGAYGLTKAGAGTLLLSGSNTYSGPTAVNEGTLKLGNDEVLANAGTVSVGSSGTLDMNGNDETVAAFSGSGAITNTGVGTSTLTAGSASSTFSGAISGAIALVKTGAGALTLSGDNSYTGGTTLNAGTLNINSATALGAAAATFTIAGGTIDNTSGSAITLTNNNAQAWNGNFTFAGTNSLNLGTGMVTLGANESVTVNANTLTVGGTIRGAYSLTKAGNGALTLSGNNTYTGGTTLSAGTLNINSATALGATAGVLTITGGTIDNTSGSALVLTNNNAQAWNGDFTFAGTNALDMGTGAVTLGADRTVDVDASELKIGGAIGGSHGLTKTGAGTLTLYGTNTSGLTSLTINEGTLNLNEGLATGLIYSGASVVNVAVGKNLTGAVTTGTDGVGTLNFLGATTTGGNIGSLLGNRLLAVNFNGTTTLAHDVSAVTTTIGASSTVTLSGNHGMNSNLALSSSSGSVLDLGTSTLTMSGTSSYTQGNTAKLKTTLSSPTSYGNIKVADGATLTATVGATSVVEVTNNITGYIANNMAFKIIDGTSGGNVSVANAANWTLPSTIFWRTTATGGEDLTLTVDRYNGYDKIATDKTTKAIGAVLEAVGSSGASGDMLTVLNTLDRSNSASEVRSALSTMKPVVDGGLLRLQMGMLNDFTGTAVDRMTTFAIDDAGQDFETGMSSGDEFEDEMFWGRVLGNTQKQKDGEFGGGYTANTYGFVVGGDQRLPGRPFRVGSALGYSTGELTSEDGDGSNTVHSYQGTLYGSYQQDNSPFFVDNAWTLAYNTYDSLRKITGAGLSRTAKADYRGKQLSVMADAGYAIRMNSINFTPIASLQYSRLMIDGYTETGADALDLIVRQQDYNLLQTAFGFRLDATFDSGDLKWRPEFRVKWLRDLVAEKQKAKAAFAGGGSFFDVEGEEPDRGALDIGTKITMLTKENVSVSLNYDLLMKKGYSSHSGFAEVGFRW